MNQYIYRAAFSVLALGLAALALATLTMLTAWPVAQARDWAGPARRVSAQAASAGLLTPLHLV
jgi:hypothetical protein